MAILTLNNYSLLFEKCKKEVGELQRCNLHPDYDFLMFNVILSLSHLFEWYLVDDSAPKKIECIKLFNPFRDIDSVPGYLKSQFKAVGDFPEKNEYQALTRELCNKAKHFKKEKDIELQERSFNVELGDDEMECGNSDADCGGFDHYIYFVELHGNKVNLELLVTSLIEEWSFFINSDS